MKFTVFILLLSIFGFSTGAKILGVLHNPVKSHYIIGTSLLHGLANKGHEVTILSPFNSTKKISNVRQIYIDGAMEAWEDHRKIFFNETTITSLWEMKNFFNHIMETALQSEGMRKLLNSKETFDVVVIESFFGNDAFFGLGHVFNSHVVVLGTGGSMPLNSLAGNVAPYSFVPNKMLTYSDKMTFIQRVINTLSLIGFNFFKETLNGSFQRNLYEKYFKGAPDFEDSRRNGSLFLANTNIIFETPRPYLPNMIQVGGMHIQEPKKLPQDLQEFLDNSKHGVILFSLGSVLESTDIPQQKRETILKVLAKLPQNIIWKFEDENLPGKPKNVKINKWLPQSDILAHPNVKLFITHGGLLGSTEAVYRGVPILGIPFYADQHSNVANLVGAGYGQNLALSDITEETFSNKLEEVLSNPRYRENIKRDSEILKDQPMKPLDRAIFWVEHIIRHNGGHHLRCASLDLSLAEYLLLDVTAFIIFVLGTFIVGIYLSIRTVFRCFKSKPKKENKERRKPKKSKHE